MIGIYKFQNKITQQVYIGQSINIEKRFKSHKKDYINGNNKFYMAIQEFGWDNFTFEILEECSVEQLNQREKYWIQYYDSFRNGYNSNGGGSRQCFSDNIEKAYWLWKDGFNPKEIANKLNIALSSVYYGLNCYPDFIKNKNEDKIQNTIYQYKLSGEFIQTWPSAKEAQKQLNIDGSSIGKVIAGKRNSAGGFQWKKYYKEKIEPLANNQTSLSKAIYQYSLNKEFIQKFNTLQEAALIVHGDSSTIRRACNSDFHRTAYSYRWSYNLIK